jgi:hypothetical protein
MLDTVNVHVNDIGTVAVYNMVVANVRYLSIGKVIGISAICGWNVPGVINVCGSNVSVLDLPNKLFLIRVIWFAN